MPFLFIFLFVMAYLFRKRKVKKILFSEFDDGEKDLETREFFNRIFKLERLSKPFPEVRVDMYNIDGKIYFSEMTFYHNGGYNESTPKDFVKKMGDMIKLPIEKNKKSKN